jgi:hypothetical protein
MNILRDYMDRELYSTLPIVQQHNWRPLVDVLRRNRIFSPKKRGRRMTSSRNADQENGEESHPPLVHIIDFRKFSNALFIFLSDGTCQVWIFTVVNPGNLGEINVKLAMIMNLIELFQNFSQLNLT